MILLIYQIITLSHASIKCTMYMNRFYILINITQTTSHCHSEADLDRRIFSKCQSFSQRPTQKTEQKDHQIAGKVTHHFLFQTQSLFPLYIPFIFLDRHLTPLHDSSATEAYFADPHEPLTTSN